jgi:hypothetical protein
MKIVLRDFNAKMGKEDIFKPTIGNESSHEIINDNGVRVVNLPHIKTSHLIVQCSHIATFINTIGSLQMGKATVRFIIF